MITGRSTSAQEQQWISEVLYLHSLWHRGPPRKPHPPPSSSSSSSGTSSALSARRNRKITKKNPNRSLNLTPMLQQFPPPPDPNPWPCPPKSPPNPQNSGWPEPLPRPKPPPPSPATMAQKAALNASRYFFSRSADDGELGYDEDEEMEDEIEEGASGFFLGLFERDSELRGYYERNWEKGEFSCLVCAALGVRAWKRFPDCVGLVQHSRSIWKTKGMLAHRGFAKAVCKVMGWNVESLPSIIYGSGSGPSLAAEGVADQQGEGTEIEPSLSAGTGKDVGKGIAMNQTYSDDAPRTNAEASSSAEVHLPNTASFVMKGEIGMEVDVKAGTTEKANTSNQLFSDVAVSSEGGMADTMNRKIGSKDVGIMGLNEAFINDSLENREIEVSSPEISMPKEPNLDTVKGDIIMEVGANTGNFCIGSVARSLDDCANVKEVLVDGERDHSTYYMDSIGRAWTYIPILSTDPRSSGSSNSASKLRPLPPSVNDDQPESAAIQAQQSENSLEASQEYFSHESSSSDEDFDFDDDDEEEEEEDSFSWLDDDDKDEYESMERHHLVTTEVEALPVQVKEESEEDMVNQKEALPNGDDEFDGSHIVIDLTEDDD